MACISGIVIEELGELDEWLEQLCVIYIPQWNKNVALYVLSTSLWDYLTSSSCIPPGPSMENGCYWICAILLYVNLDISVYDFIYSQ